MCESKVMYKGEMMNPSATEIINYTPKLRKYIKDAPFLTENAITTDGNRVVLGRLEENNFLPTNENINKIPEGITAEEALRLEKASLPSELQKGLTLILNNKILKE
ncbi:MAG: hypothetical protein ACOC1P_03810 [Minisyncoccales bacterium]